MPQNGAERPDPPICVHYCDPKATHNLSPQPNSVHKRPKTAPRGHFGQSVYTPASPRLPATAPQPNSVHKCPKTARRGPILPFVYTIAIPRPPTTQAHGPTVYTNAPKQRREAILANLCTLLRHRPGGEGHATGAVTQPPTHTSLRSLVKVLRFAGRLGAMAATLPFGVTCLFDGP